MKNNKLKILLKTISFLIIIFITITLAGKVLLYKAGTDKYKDFYKEKSQFDVLFFGSSRVLDAFQPMELWEEYGIRSYNMAQHSESLGRDYWQLKNALKHNVPRLVVVDISAYFGLYEIDPSNEDQKGALHKQIDHIPLSLTKLETIYELCPSGSRSEYIFPFILYHARWNEVSSYDFTSGLYKDARKGAESRHYYEIQEAPVWNDEDKAESFPFEQTKIKEIIDLCKEYNTSLLFVNLPYVFSEEYQGMLNYISDYFEANNIAYINYQKDNDFIDYRTDFADSAHLNTSGSIKLTLEFGKYFVENYGISPTDAKTTADWNEVLDLYKAEKDNLIANAGSYLDLLMLTYADNDYEVKVYTNPERFNYTGTYMFLPEQEGIEGISNYRLEIYKNGQSVPYKVWEVD